MKKAQTKSPTKTNETPKAPRNPRSTRDLTVKVKSRIKAGLAGEGRNHS